MQILKSTFLYLLLALFAVGGVIALTPSQAQAQGNYCSITYVATPGTIDAGESGRYTLVGECDPPNYYSYGIYNRTDEMWVLGDDYKYTDGETFGHTEYSTLQCSGNSGTETKQLEARLEYNGPVTPHPYDCPSCWDAFQEAEVVVNCGAGEPESCSIDGIDISGPSQVDAGDTTWSTYTANFDYSNADRIRYRWFVEDEWTRAWESTTGDSGSISEAFGYYDPGTYRLCVTANAQTGPWNDANTCDTQTSCMTVNVTGEPQDATLYLRSQNPSSGVGMDVVSGDFSGNRYETSKTLRRDGGISMRVYAEPTADNGNEFGNWDGCDEVNGSGNRACEITVSPGEAATIRAIYNEVTPPGKATVYVRSSNPSSGVDIDSNGNLHDGNTSYTIERDVDLSGSLWADASEDGNDFKEWQGCDSRDGRRCDVSVSTDDSPQTVTAVYEGGGDEEDFCDLYPNHSSCTSNPGNATLNVYSSNPSSGVDMDAPNSDDIPDDFRTSETITKNSQISGSIWAERVAPNDNVFDGWEGDCKAKSGNRCDVSVNVGQTHNITANYRKPTSPPNRAIINVFSSDPSSGVRVVAAGSYKQEGQNNLHDINGTPGEINRDYNLIGRLWAEQEAPNGNIFSEWEGDCEGDSGGGRRYCDISVSVGNVKNITADYMNPPDPEPAVINNFRVANDADIDFDASPPEIHIDDQPFELIWSTENANTVTATGDWSGNKSTSGSEYETKDPISGNAETFTFTLTAYGDDGNDSETVEITVLDPPRFDLSSDSEADIDGEPGSQATVNVSVSSYKYSGDVLLEVLNSGIPEILKDDEGNSKIAFSFDPNEVDTSGNSTLTVEILQPIYENLSETITITGTDQNGGAEPRVQTTSFVLNIDGFNPRTIEEF